MRSRTLLTGWTVVVLASTLGAVGCDSRAARAAPSAEARAAQSTETRAVQVPAASAAPLFASPSTLAAARSAFEHAAGGKVEALELTIGPEQLVLQARHPQARDRVQQTVYAHGLTSAPVDVDLRGPGTLEDNLFPLAEVRLDRIPELCRTAIERVEAGASVTRVVVRRNLPTSPEVRIRVYVAGTQRVGQLDADQQGTPL